MITEAPTLLNPIWGTFYLRCQYFLPSFWNTNMIWRVANHNYKQWRKTSNQRKCVDCMWLDPYHIVCIRCWCCFHCIRTCPASYLLYSVPLGIQHYTCRPRWPHHTCNCSHSHMFDHSWHRGNPRCILWSKQPKHLLSIKIRDNLKKKVLTCKRIFTHRAHHNVMTNTIYQQRNVFWYISMFK